MYALKTLGMREQTLAFVFFSLLKYSHVTKSAKYRILAYLNMLEYYIFLCISRRVDPLSLEKVTNGSFAKWISSNVWYIMHVANNDATQYCEMTERGTAEIRSQKRDRMRVQEVRADGKVVVAGWIYRPCRFIEMSPSVSRYFWYYNEDSLVHRSWKYKKKRIKFRILLSHLCFSYLALSSTFHTAIRTAEIKGRRKMR